MQPGIFFLLLLLLLLYVCKMRMHVRKKSSIRTAVGWPHGMDLVLAKRGRGPALTEKPIVGI